MYNKIIWRTFIFTLLFFFSFWLMTFTFNSSTQDSTINIAGRLQSDFSAHLPLIRSFSRGNNFPPTHPLFAGEPYHYYFGFYALAGLLEKTGLPIGWAVNVPSILTFWLLTVLIYLTAAKLFGSELTGVFSVILFLFNSSLSFLEFFKEHPLSPNTLFDIVSSKSFSSFGPWDGKTVSAFWNLNIYTNQRHLALAFASVLLSVYLLLGNKQKFKHLIFIWTILSILPLLHLVGYMILVLILFTFFLIFPEKRLFILKASLALPLSFLTYFFLVRSPIGQPMKINPNYLIEGPLTFYKFIRHWFFNLGFSLITIPLGFVISQRFAKKILLSAAPVLLIGHLVQFSVEMAANHKFFNLFMIFGNMFTAHVLLNVIKLRLPLLLTPLKYLVFGTLFLLLTLSGILDFFPVKNDAVGKISDFPGNETVRWIVENTPSRSTFLNNTYIYNPASLAGRPVLMGWPYFPWSGGYDTNTRGKLMESLLKPENKTELCRILKFNNISYIILSHGFTDLETNKEFFAVNFVKEFEDPNNGFRIYGVNKSCN